MQWLIAPFSMRTWFGEFLKDIYSRSAIQRFYRAPCRKSVGPLFRSDQIKTVVNGRNYWWQDREAGFQMRKVRSKIVFRNRWFYSFIAHPYDAKNDGKNKSIAWGRYALLFGAIIVTQMRCAPIYFRTGSVSVRHLLRMLFVILVALMFAVFITDILDSFIGLKCSMKLSTQWKIPCWQRKSEEEIKPPWKVSAWEFSHRWAY